MQPSPSPSIVSGISQGTQEKMSHQILIFLLDLLNFINIFFNLFSRFHWLFFLFIRLTALQNGNVGFTRQTHAIVRALQKCRMHYACGENIAKLLVHVSHSRTFDTHIPYKYISIMHMRHLYPAISIYTKASARLWKIHEKKIRHPEPSVPRIPGRDKKEAYPPKKPRRYRSFAVESKGRREPRSWEEIIYLSIYTLVDEMNRQPMRWGCEKEEQLGERKTRTSERAGKVISAKGRERT